MGDAFMVRGAGLPAWFRTVADAEEWSIDTDFGARRASD
jgi:hypothetical protein